MTLVEPHEVYASKAKSGTWHCFYKKHWPRATIEQDFENELMKSRRYLCFFVIQKDCYCSTEHISLHGYQLPNFLDVVCWGHGTKKPVAELTPKITSFNVLLTLGIVSMNSKLVQTAGFTSNFLPRIPKPMLTKLTDEASHNSTTAWAQLCFRWTTNFNDQMSLSCCCDNLKVAKTCPQLKRRIPKPKGIIEFLRSRLH